MQPAVPEKGFVFWIRPSACPLTSLVVMDAGRAVVARPAVLTADGPAAVRARTGPFRGPGPAEAPVPCPLGLRGQAAACSITFSGS